MPPILRLHDPVPLRGRHGLDELHAGAAAAGFDLERLALTPGRSLGADEFDRLQRWQRARVDVLLAGRTPGIVSGLEVEVRHDPATGALDPALRIAPGVAIGADGLPLMLPFALDLAWGDVVAASFLGDPAAAGATRHLAHLVLERMLVRTLPGTIPEAARREELDSTLDRRLDVFVRARLVPLPGRVVASLAGVLDAAPERIANVVAAALLREPLLAEGESGVVVALVGLDASRTARWVDLHGARRFADRLGAHAALAAQCGAAFETLLTALPRDPAATDDQRAAELAAATPLDFLPAAGTLPPELLVDPAGAPRCTLLPASHARDLVPIRSSDVDATLRAELGRPPLELAGTLPDRVRLLLEVADRDWRPDLIDVPVVDETALRELFERWRRANDAFAAWRAAFLGQRFAPGAAGLVAQGAAGRLSRTLAGGGFARQVELDGSELAALGAVPLAAPQTPAAFLDGLDARARTDAGLDVAAARSALPRPFRDLPLDAGAARDAWLAGHASPVAPTPPPSDPTAADTFGRVVQRAFLHKYLAALDDELSARELTVSKARDQLLGFRHQLDAHSFNLAALAGGTATDGSGLQLMRKLPFADLEPVITSAAPATPPSGGGTGGSSAGGFSFLVGPALFANPLAVASPISGATLASVPLTAASSGSAPISAPTSAAAAAASSAAGSGSFRVISNIAPEVYTAEAAQAGIDGLLAGVTQHFAGASIVANVEQRLAAGAMPAGGAGSDLQSRYSLLVKQGRALVDATIEMEGFRSSAETAMRALALERSRRREELARLDAAIAAAEPGLAALAAALAEAQDDHALAQGVVAEDFAKVTAADQARSDVLRHALGLHYVRARDVRAERPPADPLPLRTEQPGDLVPGIGVAAIELPDELDPFLDLLGELAITEFASLAPLAPLAPRRARAIDTGRLGAARRVALVAGATQRVERIAVRIGATRGATLRREALALWSRLPTRIAEERGPPSVLDAANGRKSRLQTAAATLLDELDRGAGTLLALLNAIPAGPRLRFAEEADDDRLPLEEPLRWPLLAQVEARSLSLARSLVELVDWWFARLAKEAGATARSALRNALRALLLVAAHGDPSDLLRGSVDVAAPTLETGTRLRLRLSRDALPGTLLRLHDESQVVRAVLAIEERDDAGLAVARVVRPLNGAVAVSTRFTVTGRAGGID